MSKVVWNDFGVASLVILYDQLKKETNFYMKSTGITVWWSFSGKQPNYSFSWQVLLSQSFIFSQQIYT